jgi:uncharacterized protein (TIGR04255 family)
LKDDCITEAMLELRFSVDELDEITIGKLSSFQPWSSFKKNRLAAAHIPQPIRTMDPGLQYQATVELIAPDKSRRVRIGSSVISYHCLGRYIGWQAFQPELNDMIRHFYDAIGGVVARRIGLRYVNVLTPRRHSVSSFDVTALKVTVRDAVIGAPLNVNFEEQKSNEHLVMTRMATPQFVQGLADREAALVVDVDVYTPASFVCRDAEYAHDWVDRAHTFEKESFFRLFPDALVQSWEAQ